LHYINLFASGLDLLRGYGGVGWQFGPEAPLKLLAQLSNFHSRHDNEFAAQHFPRLILIRQLARNAAILTLLVPAESSVGYRFRANKLEASQQRVALGHLELLAQDSNVHELFIGTKRFRHNKSCPPWTGRRVRAEVVPRRITLIFAYSE